MYLDKFNISLKDETILHIETPCINTFKRLNKKFEDILKNLSIDEFLSSLNSVDGQFRIKFENKKFIGVVVDRWSSLPFFFNKEEKKYQKEVTEITSLNDLSIYSLFLYRRLWGKMTLDKETIKIQSGTYSIFDLDRQKLNEYRWHDRSFSKKIDSEDAHQNIVNTLKEFLPEENNYSLLLSGGLDTRFLLSCLFERIESTETLCFSSFSRELLAARKLSELVNVNHRKIIKNPYEWFDSIKEIIHHAKQGYIPNSLFCLLPKYEGIRICGIGLDYTFQGMYLPQLRESRPIPKSIDDLLKNLPCGNRYFLSQNSQHNKEFDLEITKIINQEIFRGDDLSGNIDDDFRKILFDDPSMHYSYTDYLSQSSRGRTLIPGFNNSLDDLWQSIDSSILLNKKFTIELLRTSNPEFLKVNSANNNLPIEWNIVDRMLLYSKNLFRNKVFTRPYEHEVRTWPTHGFLLKILSKDIKLRDFFMDRKDLIPFISAEYLEKEISWFENKISDKSFGRVHSDRENSLFYLFGILMSCS